MPYEEGSKRIFVLKSITQAKGADDQEYRTSNVRLGCVGTGFGIWFAYRRELPSNEIGVATVIRVAAGDRELVLGPGTKGVSDLRSAITDREFLQHAVAVPNIVIIETFAPQDNGSGWSREIKFSIKGLSQALLDLQRVCSGPNFLDAPAVKFLDLPGVSRGR